MREEGHQTLRLSIARDRLRWRNLLYPRIEGDKRKHSGWKNSSTRSMERADESMYT